MSAHKHIAASPPLDLGRWRSLPGWLMGVGGVLALTGLLVNPTQFGYSWLLAFMFCLSLCLGAMFLVLVHHLFDAGWSVPIRRFCEHLACLSSPAMALLFVPIAVLATRLYPWLGSDLQHSPDHALAVKWPLFTKPMFYLTSVFCFGAWWLVSSNLRKWSLRQDEDGSAACTYAMRRWSAVGIFLFAITLTLAAVLWMKSLEHAWFSTMYGVYYFAASVWLTLATVYVITVLLERTGKLRGLLHEHQYYFLGTLLFAFTVFYAYIHLSQYFIIWNANIPEETFWYKLRERGSWWNIGMILIFGHFFVPFLALLRIDAKHSFPLMTFLCVWAWLMHFFDLAFNIMPVPHPEGFPLRWLWLDLGCLALMVGWLLRLFLGSLGRHRPYPVKDPRLAEALGHYHPKPRLMSGGELGETEDIEEQLEGPIEPEQAAGGTR
ncbi:MAG: hypothetical protein KJ072_18840 [Verrucomicrobia bacterium]|nr:hypothetical protein [Verrucomicrobiota bacterium]